MMIYMVYGHNKRELKKAKSENEQLLDVIRQLNAENMYLELELEAAAAERYNASTTIDADIKQKKRGRHHTKAAKQKPAYHKYPQPKADGIVEGAVMDLVRCFLKLQSLLIE